MFARVHSHRGCDQSYQECQLFSASGCVYFLTIISSRPSSLWFCSFTGILTPIGRQPVVPDRVWFIVSDVKGLLGSYLSTCAKNNSLANLSSRPYLYVPYFYPSSLMRRSLRPPTPLVHIISPYPDDWITHLPRFYGQSDRCKCATSFHSPHVVFHDD